MLKVYAKVKILWSLIMCLVGLIVTLNSLRQLAAVIYQLCHGHVLCNSCFLMFSLPSLYLISVQGAAPPNSVHIIIQSGEKREYDACVSHIIPFVFEKSKLFQKSL